MNKEDKHPILKAIPFDKKVTRKELSLLLKTNDRAVRDLINKARKDTAILSNSKEKGYRRTKTTDQLITKEDVLIEINEIEHCLAEITSRMNDYKFQKRSLIAHLKMLQKKNCCDNNNSVN